MTNPWRDILPDDYVGHMSSPAVGQHQALGRLFGDTLTETRPREVLLLGCSTGNGLEHVDPAVTARVCAVDLNAQFIARLVERFPEVPFTLDVQCADLAVCTFSPGAYDLVHGALVFEYLDWTGLLPRLVSALRPGGTLSAIFQLPSATLPAVTPTGFTTLHSLETIFRFVDPDVFIAQAAVDGLTLQSRCTERLESGKAFEIVRLVKRRPAPITATGQEGSDT